MNDYVIFILVRDLIFSSRIVEAARGAGVRFKVIRDVAAIPTEDETLCKLIVDLGQDGFLEAAARWKRGGGGEVIGFVSHVDEQTIRRAHEAGLDRVLSRGAFTQQLPSLIRGSRSDQTGKDSLPS